MVIVMRIDADIAAFRPAEGERFCQNPAGLSISGNPVNRAVWRFIQPGAVFNELISWLRSDDKCENTANQLFLNDYIGLFLADIIPYRFGKGPVRTPLMRISGKGAAGAARSAAGFLMTANYFKNRSGFCSI